MGPEQPRSGVVGAMKGIEHFVCGAESEEVRALPRMLMYPSQFIFAAPSDASMAAIQILLIAR